MEVLEKFEALVVALRSLQDLLQDGGLDVFPVSRRP
jgi:hypothetical protein